MDIYGFLEKNTFYIILLIAVIIMAGLFLYVLNLSRKVSELEKDRRQN